jgi:hypothetical protein
MKLHLKKLQKIFTIMLSGILLLGVGWIAPAHAGTPGTVTGHIWKRLSDFAAGKIAYDGKGTYVGIRSLDGKLFTSTDLVTWNPVDISAQTTRLISTLEYINGKFYAGTGNGGGTTGATMLRSENGTDWEAVGSNDPSITRSAIAYGNNTFVVQTKDWTNYYYRSANGENNTWVRYTLPIADPSMIKRMLFADNRFTAVGTAGSILTSLDGAAWQMAARVTGAPMLNGIATNGNGQYVAVGDSGTIVRNDPGNGIHYPVIPVPTQATNTMYDVVYSVEGGGYLAVGNYAVLFSADGINWVNESGLVFQTVLYGDHKWIASGNSGLYQRVDVTLEISAQPEDKTVVQGANPVLTMTASAGTEQLDYQWYSNSSKSNSGGQPIAGATSSTYYAPTTTTGTKYYYGVATVRGSSISITSDPVAVTVNPPIPAVAPGITVQPSDLTVNRGEQVSLSVSASAGDGGTLTYEWYRNTSNSNSGGQLIPGAWSSTYTVPTSISGTAYYYVIITNTNSEATGTKTAKVTSRAAAVTVNIPLTYTISAIADQTAAPLIQGYESDTQDTKTIHLTNTGTGNLNNLSVALSGSHADDFVLTQPAEALPSGAPATSFTVKAKDGLAAGTYTATVTITADHMEDVTFTVTQAVNLPDAPANPQSLTALGGNREVTLNWNTVTEATYYNVYMSGVTGQFNSEASATVTGLTYTIPGLANGTAYYFIVKAGNPGGLSAASNEVEVTPATVPGAPGTITATAGNGQVTLTFTAPADDGGSPITEYEVTDSTGTITVTGAASPITVTGLENDKAYTFTVTAMNSMGKSEASVESHTVTPKAPVEDNSGSGDGEGNGDEDTTSPSTPPATPGAPAAQTGVDVLVNGKAESAGTATTTAVNNRTVTTIALDQQKLENKLQAEGRNAVVTIVATAKSDVIAGELNGQMIKNMEDRQAVLQIQTEAATYTLPARQINIAAISDQVGRSVALQDIKIRIEIAAASADSVKAAGNAAQKGNFALVGAPVDFTVKGIYGEETVEVSKFNAYVERNLALPEGVDPNKITTGVVVEPDGTVRHVPTRITQVNGRYYAQINSLTNSTYSVVWHPITFGDVENHWAKEAVNDMGSRMVIEGMGSGSFLPDQDISRAEFAAIIVRGLGLKLENGQAPFTDVNVTDWYNSAVHTASTYRLISGFEDGTFRPNDMITREEAMVIIANAMSLTGLKEKLPADAAGSFLQSYADAEHISGWARSSVADSIQAGIVSGRSGSGLEPVANMTRAEVAAIVQRLLAKSGLI